MEYYRRDIDIKLLEWKNGASHKPLIVRGARQVGKSSAVQHLAKQFDYFVEVNLEKRPELRNLFDDNIDVHRLCQVLSATMRVPIIPGKTLLFIDEIQSSKAAIQSLRYFWEEMPELHVVAAGSLLEFALEEMASFAVGRIRSLYLYPFSFKEFLLSQGLDAQLEIVSDCVRRMEAVPEPIHRSMCDQLRTFYLVGGMPESVSTWNKTKDFGACGYVQSDIIESYQQDFVKYKKRVNPDLLRQVFRSVALQAGNKFVAAQVNREIPSTVIKEALHLLALAGVVHPCTHTAANGLPLGAEVNNRYVKYLLMDNGLMQNLLSLQAEDVLLSDSVSFVNKGPFSEMFAGLELIKRHDPFRRAELYYWQNTDKGAQGEIDYLAVVGGEIIPIEAKASTRGSMQSLYQFMQKHHSAYGVRTSMENVSVYSNGDYEVHTIPLYALSYVGDMK